ncbi:MAG: nucleoside hydrolase [Clostridia bacterium]|nr:nucleoside hydrolase [Clostridia bacterium]
MEKLPVIIDADPGIDDAVALMMAIKSNKLDIKMLGASAGNIGIQDSSYNCLALLDMFDASSIPVCAGNKKPFKRTTFGKTAFHGNHGMGGYVLEKSSRELTPTPSFEKMHEILEGSENKITILTLAPLTNVALLLQNHPEDIKKIEKIVIMGGSTEEDGIKQPYPEFNIASDPEACEAVLNSGAKIVIIPMELGHTAYLDWREVFQTKNTNLTGEILEIIFRGYKDRHVKNGIATHDATALAYLLAPEIYKTEEMNVYVKYFESIDSGVIICDKKNKPNAIVATDLDIKKFKKLYFKLLKRCK